MAKAKRTKISLLSTDAGAEPSGSTLPRVEHSSLASKNPPRSISKYGQKLLQIFAPHILPAALEKLRAQVLSGDPGAMRDAFEIYGLRGGKGSPLIQTIVNQNNLVANQAASSGSGHRGFDAFVRRREALAVHKAQTAEPSPSEAIMDAESTPVA